MNLAKIRIPVLIAVIVSAAGTVGFGRSAAGAGTGVAASPGQMVVINAATNPADAVDALKLYENATDRSFTPSADPSYGQTKWGPVTDANGEPAPSVTGNAQAGKEVTERLDITHEETSSWSLGGSIETSVGFDLAEIVDVDLSVKFTANHTWESSTKDSQGIWITAEPGKTVWIEAATTTASFSGNFAFTSGGVRYVVQNVTITQPAASDADSSAATVYRVMEAPSGEVGVAPNTTGGLIPMRELPKLGAYIRSGH